MKRSLVQHWPEYLIEGALLGIFMLSAISFTALLQHPQSPVKSLLPNPGLRRALIGLAMGLTAIALIYSPWGKRSGAHMNPATTLTFLQLGKIRGWDASFFMAAHFVGGAAGIVMAKLLWGQIISDPSVNYVVTVPGTTGVTTAFGAEFLLAAGMMFTVLISMGTPRTAQFTGLFAGLLVFLFITFEAPLSGMSINPARTVASALPSGIWTSVWVYLTAPVLGMMLAAQAYAAAFGLKRTGCARLVEHSVRRCIFCGNSSEAAGKGGRGLPRPRASAVSRSVHEVF